MLCNVLLSNIPHFLVSAYRFTSFKHLYNIPFYECSIIGHSPVFFFSLYCGNVQAYIIEEGITYPLSSFNCFSHLASSVSSTDCLPPIRSALFPEIFYFFVCFIYFSFFPRNILKQILFVYITSPISICVSHKGSSCNITTMPLSNLKIMSNSFMLSNNQSTFRFSIFSQKCHCTAGLFKSGSRRVTHCICLSFFFFSVLLNLLTVVKILLY